jgi:hypothetical protein
MNNHGIFRVPGCLTNVGYMTLNNDSDSMQNAGIKNS